jgi:PAS domain S-box-containing protein
VKNGSGALSTTTTDMTISGVLDAAIRFPGIALKSVSEFISRMGLRLKWMLLTLIILILFSFITLTVLISAGSKNLRNELEYWAESLAKNIAISARVDEAVKDSPRLQNYLSGTMIRDELLYVVILDRDGTILAKVDEKWLFNPDMHDRSIQLDKTEFLAGFSPKFSDYLHLVYVHDANPVTTAPGTVTVSSGSQRYKVILGISLSGMYKKINDMRKRAIFYILLTTALIFLWVWYSIRQIVHPIHDLVIATKKVARGNLTSFIDNKRRDELGTLADSFNRMLVRLNRSKKREKQYTMELEQKVQERTHELKASENKYRTLFEHSGTAVTLFHEDDIIIMVNQEFESLSGYSKADIEGEMSFLRFLVNRDQKKIRENYLNRRKTEVGNIPISYDCTFIDRNNAHRNVNLTLTAVPGSENILASLADVTELRGLQKRLIHSEHLAAIGELSASIAHEIRNPLGAINTSIGILKNDIQLQGENRELMDIISEESMRLKSIIDDFLHFTHPGVLTAKEIDLNTIISETLLLFKSKLNNGIARELDLAENLPPLYADPNQLKQVFINIIVNALDMMQDEGTLSFTTRMRKNTFETGILKSNAGIRVAALPPKRLKKSFNHSTPQSRKGQAWDWRYANASSRTMAERSKLRVKLVRGPVSSLLYP